MQRFLSLIALFFLFSASFVALAQDLNLAQLYDQTGAELEETELQAWLLMSKRYNESDVDKLLADLTKAFGYQIQGSIQQTTFQENFQQAFAIIDFAEAKGWFTVQRMQNFTFSSGMETYLGLRASHQGDWPSLALYRARVRSDFSPYGKQGDLQFFTTLIGSRPGDLDMETREEIIESVRKQAGADVVDNFVQGGLSTVSLLAPDLPDKLVAGDQEFNLHLAFRFNEAENRTYVYLGTPIIAPDY